jgi:hypothetical protein
MPPRKKGGGGGETFPTHLACAAVTAQRRVPPPLPAREDHVGSTLVLPSRLPGRLL